MTPDAAVDSAADLAGRIAFALRTACHVEDTPT